MRNKYEKSVAYDEIWIICRCSLKIGGTILRGEEFEFTCIRCGRTWSGNLKCSLNKEALYEPK